MFGWAAVDPKTFGHISGSENKKPRGLSTTRGFREENLSGALRASSQLGRVALCDAGDVGVAAFKHIRYVHAQLVANIGGASVWA